MIKPFQVQLWRFAKHENKFNTIKNYCQISFRTKGAWQGGPHSASQFQWLLFLGILSSGHRQFLRCERVIAQQVKSVFRSLPDFPAQSYLEHIFKRDLFDFLNDYEKERAIDSLLYFSDILVKYKTGDLIKDWGKYPEDWVIKTVKALLMRKNLSEDLSWNLGRVLHQLGYFCVFSKVTSSTFFQYIDDYENQPPDDYIRWVQVLSSLSAQEKYALELAGELLLTSKLACRDFLAFSAKGNPHYKRIKKTGDNLLQGHEEMISDSDLIDFLYRPRILKDETDKASRANVFYDIERNFIPLSSYQKKRDWISFWRGTMLFFKRQLKFRNENLEGNAGILLDSPLKVEKWFRGFQPNRQQESLWCVALDNKNIVQDVREISRGTVDQTMAHPREVFALAIENHASSIILLHNHPSGDPAPSPNDLEITERMRESGNLLGVRMIDHIIIGKDRFYSFNEGFFKSQ